MIKKEHVEDFMFRMRMLEFDRCFPNGFEKKCDDVLDLLQVKAKVPYPKEKLHFVMRIKYSMLDGFTPLGVHMKLYNFGDIAHVTNESIDSKKIEEQLIPVSHGEVSYRRVQDNMEKLKNVSSEGATVAEQLIAKYILGTDEEKNVPGINDIRIKYTRAYSFDMGDNVTEYSLTEMRSLLLGRCVYKMQPDLHQGAWMKLEEEDGEIKLKQFAQHYNYDLKQVFRQLPHAVLLDEKDLELVDYQFRNGMRIRLFLYENSQITKVEAIADPLNRSLILFEEGTNNTIPMSRYVSEMKPPVEIDYYKVYINNRFIINSNSYADVSRWAIDQTDPVRVVGTLPGKIPVFDSRGNLKEGTGLLILSKNVKRNYFPYLSEHISSGDISTPYERDLRKTFRNYPYLKESDYERAYGAIQKARTQNKPLSVETALSDSQIHSPTKLHRHEKKFRHHL